MKKLLLLTFISTLFAFTSDATHIAGGEITWKCANGQYRFYMTVYRDCGGFTAGFQFVNQTIDIFGGQLPRNTLNQPFNTITMFPDSARWLRDNNGEIMPPCSSIGVGLSCVNRDQGAFQAFYFQSNPITMSGVPPSNGWTFYWQSPCCRPGNMNNGTSAAGGKQMLLRAIMFPTKNRENVNPCIDDAPELSSYPSSVICRGQLFNLNISAIDKNLDSLAYSWASPLNPNHIWSEPYSYAPGFSSTNPTPDETFQINNIPSTLNSISGIHELAIFSGFGTEKFVVVYQVDSWREGELIASVFREHPISVFNCANLPNNNANSAPQVRINGVPSNDTVLSVFAGEEIRLPIQVSDPDSQMIRIEPNGLLFSSDRSINSLSNCSLSIAGNNDTITTCAYLQQQAPVYDSSLNAYVVEGLSSVSTEFVWKTDCSLIANKSSNNGTAESIFNFILKISDDHCPLPSVNYYTITVKVKDAPPLKYPVLKGASVGLNGVITYQWIPPLDSVYSFDKYKVQGTTQLNGDPPAFGTTYIENNLRIYANGSEVAYPVFMGIGGNPFNGPDILNKIPNRDWYFRMNTVSGCKAEIESAFSEPIRVIELDANFSAFDSSIINLNWNTPKPLQFNSTPQYIYESMTYYYIWQCDSVETVDVRDELDWYVREKTFLNSFQLTPSICGGKTAFRVEARDTVITLAQGSGKLNPEFDTLYFSTFSIIDTLHTFSQQPSVVHLFSNQLQTSSYGDNYEWLDCQTGQLIQGATRNTYSPSGAGSFAVIVSHSGCRDTSDCFPFFTVGLEELNFQNSLSYYPNPTSGKLNIDLAKPESLQIKVFNIHGQLLIDEQKVNANRLELDLEGDAGIYFIQLTNQEGERANLKVVKQ